MEGDGLCGRDNVCFKISQKEEAMQHKATGEQLMKERELELVFD